MIRPMSQYSVTIERLAAATARRLASSINPRISGSIASTALTKPVAALATPASLDFFSLIWFSISFRISQPSAFKLHPHFPRQQLLHQPALLLLQRLQLLLQQLDLAVASGQHGGDPLLRHGRQKHLDARELIPPQPPRRAMEPLVFTSNVAIKLGINQLFEEKAA